MLLLLLLLLLLLIVKLSHLRPNQGLCVFLLLSWQLACQHIDLLHEEHFGSGKYVLRACQGCLEF